MILVDKQENIYNNEKFTIIKKAGKAGEKIDKHSHPEAYVTFTVVRGKVRLTVGEDVKEVVPGIAATWDGKENISAEFIDDSEVFVNLIKKV